MSYTPRYKFETPAVDATDWGVTISHWSDVMDVMLAQLAARNYVTLGLVLSYTAATRAFTYTEGTVQIDGVSVPLGVGGGTATAGYQSAGIETSVFTWIYVQGAQVRISTSPPSGSYAALYVIECDSTGIISVADLRVSYPRVNGANIAPAEVAPTGNVTLLSSKRYLHTDSNVGSNIVLLPKVSQVEIVSWNAQTAAKPSEEVNLSAVVSANAKMAIIQAHCHTLGVSASGWAQFELKTNVADTDFLFNVSDYGHLGANAINGTQKGGMTQFFLQMDANKVIRASSHVDTLGAGSYYATATLVGYVE